MCVRAIVPNHIESWIGQSLRWCLVFRFLFAFLSCWIQKKPSCVSARLALGIVKGNGSVEDWRVRDWRSGEWRIGELEDSRVED